MYTSVLRSAGLLTCLAFCAALLGCTDYFKPWGTATTIEELAGYKLGATQSSLDLKDFKLPMQGGVKNPEATVTINGVSFGTGLTLSFEDGYVSEIRIVAENISSEELKKLQSAAMDELRAKYSKDLVKYQSDSYDVKLADANGHYLALSTKETTIADNDGVFDYAIANRELKR